MKFQMPVHGNSYYMHLFVLYFEPGLSLNASGMCNMNGRDRRVQIKTAHDSCPLGFCVGAST